MSRSLRLVLLGALGLLAGLVTASLLSNTIFSIASAETGSRGVRIALSNIATPTAVIKPSNTPTPAVTPTNAPNHTSTPTPMPTHKLTPTPTPTPGGSTGGGTGGAKQCPETRAENSAVWDACHAGYIAPTIKFDGLVGCKAIDRANGIWSVTAKFSLVGGVYRKAEWRGLTDNAHGLMTSTVTGYMPDALDMPMLYADAIAKVWVYSMSDLPGVIDVIRFSADPVAKLSEVCS
jgi:hypothetical protein